MSRPRRIAVTGFVLLAALVPAWSQAPSNDECAGATPIVGNSISGSTTTATTSLAAQPSCGPISDDVWFVVVPNAPGAGIASVCSLEGGSASFGARIVAYSGACGSLTEVQCAVNYNIYCGPMRTSFPLVPGQPVYLRLGGGWAGEKGAFTLILQASPAPANDTCANAIPVSLGSSGPYTNVGASDGYASPSSCSYVCCGQMLWSPGYSDVWFSYTPACDGIVRLWLCATGGFAGAATIHVGPCIGVHPWGGWCGGTATCSASPSYPGWGTPLSQGVTYFIRVSSLWPWLTGTFTLVLESVWAFTGDSPLGPGSIMFQSRGGTPGNASLFAVTQNQGAFPQGWFYGIDIPIAELVSEWNWPGGWPFVQTLDACGNAPPIFIPAGIPSGLTFYCVFVEVGFATVQPVQPSLAGSITTL